MYNELNNLESYCEDEVLNPFLLLLNTENQYYKSYYQYFKKLNRPKNTSSIIGIQLEFPAKLTFNSIFYSDEIIELFQLKINQPLSLKQNRYLIIIFNEEEKQIIDHLLNHLLNFNQKKLSIKAGILICHPLTSPSDLISLTKEQLENAKKQNCMISVYNEYNIE